MYFLDITVVQGSGSLCKWGENSKQWLPNFPGHFPSASILKLGIDKKEENCSRWLFWSLTSIKKKNRRFGPMVDAWEGETH